MKEETRSMSATQREPFDLEDFTPYLLAQATEATSQRFSAFYRTRYGISQAEWRVLFFVGRYGVNAREIARRINFHKSKISRAVQGLEDRGFLERRSNPEDGRRDDLTLTGTGQEVFRDIAEAASDFEQSLRTCLHPDRVDILKDLLKELIGPSWTGGPE